jgi:quinol monooxygenase YgiN
MGFLLKLISGPFGGYVQIGATLLVVGSLSYGAIQHQSAARYRAERDAAKNEFARLVEATESKDGIIDDLTQTLQVWQDRATLSAQASTEAGQRAQDYQTQLSAARSRIRALSEADRALPDCQKLMSMDLAACPGALDGVRRWAAGGLQGSNNPSPDADRPAH